MREQTTVPEGVTLPTRKGDPDVRVAPNVWKTYRGWRAYVRHQGKLIPKRFTNDQGEQAVYDWIAGFKAKAAEHNAKVKTEKVERKGTLAADVQTWLALDTTQAMPTYKSGNVEWIMGKWVDALGTRQRLSLTERDLNQQLQRWINSGYSGGSVNKFRNTLMGLYTDLDGVGAANPVKATRVYPEGGDELQARGRDYALLVRILDAIPDRGRGIKGQGRRHRRGKDYTDTTKAGSQSKARLELFAWTGMPPAQMMLLTPEHFNIEQRWYISPQRKKGKQPRFPRPVVRKEMTDDAARAFARFAELKCWGEFSRPSLRSLWLRAVARVEKQLREELNDPTFTLARFRLYDIRHSFGSAVTSDQNGNHGPAGALMDHASERTTRRYAVAAVPAVLKAAAATFQANHGRAALAARAATK